MSLLRFQGQVALVTGASGGIGGAIAAALSSEGAEVHAVSRRENSDGALTWHQVDLSDRDALEKAVQQFVSKFGALDILVHAAGDFSTGTAAETAVTDLDHMWNTNARAPWRLTQALTPALTAKQGSVVFINSSIWDNARGGMGGYAASKYALKAIADAFRDELNPDGVRVLSVFPGRTASAMQEGMFAQEGRAYKPELLLQPEDVAQSVLQSLAAARTAETTDIHIRPAKKF